jgi:hypothetical protein
MRELSQAGLACRSTFFHNSLAEAYLRQRALQVSLRRAECPQGVDLRRSPAVGKISIWSLAQIPAGDLDIPIFAQLTPTQLPLGDALEPGPLEIVRLHTPLGCGPLGQEPLEHAPRHPDDATVFADLDPGLYRLLLGVP